MLRTWAQGTMLRLQLCPSQETYIARAVATTRRACDTRHVVLTSARTTDASDDACAGPCLELLDGEKERHALATWQLHGGGLVIKAVLLLEVDGAAVAHVEGARDLQACTG